MENQSIADKSGSPWGNIKGLFKDYGCCGGDRHDFSPDGHKGKNITFQKKFLEVHSTKPSITSHSLNEDHGHVPNTEWTELVNNSFSSNPHIRLSQAYPINSETSSIYIEDYKNNEPVHFKSKSS